VSSGTPKNENVYSRGTCRWNGVGIPRSSIPFVPVVGNVPRIPTAFDVRKRFERPFPRLLEIDGPLTFGRSIGGCKKTVRDGERCFVYTYWRLRVDFLRARAGVRRAYIDRGNRNICRPFSSPTREFVLAKRRPNITAKKIRAPVTATCATEAAR